MGSWIIKVLDRPSQCWYHCLFLAPASLFISLFYLISRHISQFWSSWVMTYAKNDGWHGCIIIFLSPRGNFSHIYYLSDKSLSLKRRTSFRFIGLFRKKIKQAVIVYMTNKSRALNANPSTRRILRSRHYLELLWNLAVFPFLPLNRGCIFLPALKHPSPDSVTYHGASVTLRIVLCVHSIWSSSSLDSKIKWLDRDTG